MTPVWRSCSLFEIDIADFCRKLIYKAYINRHRISKHVLCGNFMCSFVWQHLFVCEVNMFFYVFFFGGGGISSFFFKKSYIKWFDSPIYSMAYLEMLFHLNFYLWFLLMGHFRTILIWLPPWQLWVHFGPPFYSNIPKWPPNDVIHSIFLCFTKTLRVIHVIRGSGVIESISSDIIFIWLHLGPYSELLNKRQKISPPLPPPPPKKNK